MTPRLLAVLVLALCVVVHVAGPAGASCAMPVPGTLPPGDRVFLGEVVEQRTGFDLFSVEEVWRGPELNAQVWVQTRLAPPRWPWETPGRTSVDADLARGERYIVGLHGDFETTTCTVLAASEVDLYALRPDDARQPRASGTSGADPGRPWWPLAAAALPLAAGAALLIRRGRPAERRLSRRGA